MSIRKPHTYDLVIVGAGPAGIGMAIACKGYGINDIVVLDRHGPGSTFLQWPRETRFLSPSFPAHAFGMPDLNAVSEDLSPGEFLGQEHPDGPAYAEYLAEQVQRHRLVVDAPVEVLSVRKTDHHFALETSEGEHQARSVIWAAGEFQYPATNLFPGSMHCIPVMSLASYADAASASGRIVIGGYESGCDIACHLASAGTCVQMLDPNAPWEQIEGDPSAVLSIRTRERLDQARTTGRLQCLRQRVCRVRKGRHRYEVICENDQTIVSPEPPLLAAGFTGSLDLVGNLVDRDAHGHAVLTAEDESTSSPCFFLAGPIVRRDSLPLCFVYKFRTRFPVVAHAIRDRLLERKE